MFSFIYQKKLEALLRKIITIVFFTITSSASAHGNHRPDQNKERHKCHHKFGSCSKKCLQVLDKKNYSSCMMECFRKHKICVEKFE